MAGMTRRTVVGALAAVPLAKPAIVGAQTSSAPVRIGLLSDVIGPYSDVGGLGNKLAAEMAVEDFGGSVLGRPIRVLQADNQNKADVASALAREWIDDRGVDVLADGAGSAAALAIQQVTRERKRVYLMGNAVSTALIGRQCSPYGFQFACSNYALAKAVGGGLSRAGENTWFFVTADYEFGHSLQSITNEFVRQAGGKVVGSVRAPLGTSDFSSHLLQAQASGAKVIGLALGGTDLQNCIKQTAEFGIAERNQRLATLSMVVSDVLSLGQDACRDLVMANPFYWDLSPATRAWTKRFAGKIGKLPNEYNAAVYGGVAHWLKSVGSVGTLDADTVAAKMRELPVDDFYNSGVRIQANGCVPHTMYLWRVKPSSEAQHRWDMLKLLSTMPTPEAYPPPALFGCSLAPA